MSRETHDCKDDYGQCTTNGNEVGCVGVFPKIEDFRNDFILCSLWETTEIKEGFEGWKVENQQGQSVGSEKNWWLTTQRFDQFAPIIFS